MKRKQLLLLLALLMTVATGAWAQDAKHLITATHGKQTRLLEQPLPYETTVGELYEAVTGQSFSSLISVMSAQNITLTGISSNKTDVVSIGDLNGASTPVTVKADGEATVSINFGGFSQAIFVSVVPPLYVTMADGTKDADKWTATVGTNSNAKTLPVGGLSEKDAVTLKYNGRLKVKNVTATTDAAPAATVVDLSTVSGDTYTVTGDVILTGTPTESLFYIMYGGDDYEVTLDNVNSAGSKRVSVVGNNHNMNIKLKGTSRLMEIFTNNGATSGKTATIGEAAAGGTLILTGCENPIRAKTFTINGGTVKSQATGANWAVYLNNTVGVLTINGGALYLATGDDGTQAVKGTVSGTLYGWDGSAWVTYTNQRYATTDNTSGNPTGWTW